MPNAVDHYRSRSKTTHFNDMTLLQFVQQYKMPKKVGAEPVHRNKDVIVMMCPYCTPNPEGPKYELYGRQKLMQHVPFCQQEELLDDNETYKAVYANFLLSGSVPLELDNDLYRLHQQMTQAYHSEVS